MTAFTDGAWNTPESDLTPEQFCEVCLVDMNTPGTAKVKSKCKLPIRSKPGGAVNKNALQNAAGRMFQMTGVSPDMKKAAAKKLVSMMKEAGMEVGSESLMKMAGMRMK